MTDSYARTRLLILGLGNVLCSDDGLGIAALTQLQRQYRAPEGVDLVDGGTLGLALLPTLMDADSVILVDAVDTGQAPGAPVRIEGSDVLPAARDRLSPHQIGVADLLDGATLCEQYPKCVILLGIVPRSTELGVDLAPEVASGLQNLVERVVIEAEALGFPLTRRSEGARANISVAPALIGM